MRSFDKLAQFKFVASQYKCILVLVIVFATLLVFADRLRSNAGRLLILDSLTIQVDPWRANQHGLYGVGLANAGDEAPPANWMDTAAELELSPRIELGMQLLEPSQSSLVTNDPLWLARLHTLLGESQGAIVWADRAHRMGLSGGIREKAYALDLSGKPEDAVTAYELAASGMSHSYLLANYLTLATDCSDEACTERWIGAVASADPRNPIAVWDEVKSGQIAEADFLFTADWSYEEPRLQRAMGLALAELAQSQEKPTAVVEHFLLHWLSRGSRIAASTLLAEADAILPRQTVVLWTARLAAQMGATSTAYDTLLGNADLLQGSLQNEAFRDLATFSYGLALDGEGSERTSWLQASAGWLERYLSSKPNDTVTSNNLALVGALLQGEDVGSNPGAERDLLGILSDACPASGGIPRVGPESWPMNSSNFEFWKVASKSGEPYANGLYEAYLSPVGAGSFDSTFHLHGLAVAEQNGLWPSWIAISPESRVTSFLDPDAYAFSFDYRTDYEDGWQRTRILLTAELEAWLPNTRGEWRTFAYVIPSNLLDARGFLPILRLYHSEGSVFFQNFSLKPVYLEESDSICTSLGSVIGPDYRSPDGH